MLSANSLLYARRPGQPRRGEHKLVFTHLPKTGGSTLRQYFVRYVFGEGVSFPDALKLDPPSTWPRRTIERCRYFDAHATYAEFQGLVGPAHYITLLRDPVERVVSYYWHLVRQKDQIGRNPFDRVIRLAVDNSLSDWLDIPDAYPRDLTVCMLLSSTFAAGDWRSRHPADEGVDLAFGVLRDRYVAFGLLDEAEKTAELMRYAFFLPAATDVMAFRENQRPEGRINRMDVRPEDCARIESQNQRDTRLYELARALLHERIEQVRSERQA